MAFVNQAKIELGRLVLENSRREYAEPWDAWKVVEEVVYISLAESERS